jgi:hypothetical protein
MINFKKIVILSLVSYTCLASDVVTVMPSLSLIKYDSSSSKSLKDSAFILGVETTIKKQNYLLDLTYNYTNIEYKAPVDLQNLGVHDLAMIGNLNYLNYLLKVGVHYIRSGENVGFRDLGTGYVGIAGLQGSNYFSENKLTYGLDTYYSVYPTAHNEETTASTLLIDIMQVTPYVKYSMILNPSLRNDVSFKVNAIASTQYKDPGYLSYKFKDTLVYKNYYAILNIRRGEMKSGVTEGGSKVINTKDLYKDAYELRAGYYVMEDLAVDLSYGINYYQEYNAATLALLPEGKSSVGMISLSYNY